MNSRRCALPAGSEVRCEGFLARRYRTTVTALAQLNQLHTDVIAVGQGLLVPSPSSSPSDRER